MKYPETAVLLFFLSCVMALAGRSFGFQQQPRRCFRSVVDRTPVTGIMRFHERQPTTTFRNIIPAATADLNNNDAGTSTTESSNRRDFLLQAAAASTSCLVLTVTRPQQVVAFPLFAGNNNNNNNNNKDVNDDFRFQIETRFPKDFSPEMLGSDSALTITVKPAVTYTDQIPKDIADASLLATGHWVPIVMRYHQPCSQLACDRLNGNNSNNDNSHSHAFTLTLTNQHVTPQGADWNSWKQLPLIVTAKLDADGLDSTVGPSDLVGCRIIPNNGGIIANKQQQHVTHLSLQRRGLCSDLFTPTTTTTEQTLA